MNNHFDETVFVLEGMTSISALIRAISEGRNDRRIIEVHYDASKASKKWRELNFLKHKSEELHFSLLPCESSEIAALTSGTSSGGIIALCSGRSFAPLTSEVIAPDGFYTLIDGVEDPYNFGYILRSLYAAGANGVILPPRNWMSAAAVVARASAGTSELFDIYTDDPERCLERFREKGYRIIGAGIRDSKSLYEANLKKPLLLLIGGEKRGISSKLLRLVDEMVRIDYARDFKGSLTSAAATAVMAFEIMHQNS